MGSDFSGRLMKDPLKKACGSTILLRALWSMSSSVTDEVQDDEALERENEA